MIVRKGTARCETATAAQIAHLGDYTAELISDTGGLTQFGAFVETLAPGAASSDRHWHEAEDEFLLVLSGEATVVEDDGAHRLLPGDAACWPAGEANGHHVLNRSARACSYLVVGTRAPSDRVHYSDIDKLYTRENGTVRRTRRDGSPLD
ncbi:cupin domain-containing protein [Albidovulum sediminicola]|uniref:Cupin domain-containing protein n=1 Tax=Albidovulum sediminicola TaxID=2984331 RepID=A0ABT2Z2N5_9RHOB|nr:cupin domain-containing protein [Defluviimonas sp. WL0075]MCV2865389.1 cupin domain-containing protein [Defluviimonas sp. WL0075]